MPGPLEGIRVFDWTIYGVGPFASMLLGSLGAEVIKVEGPAGGDPQILIPPTIGGAAALYINFNLNKKSISLDLSKPDEREAALKLLAASDVFINNMRTGSPEKFGIGYDVVSQINPRIVYCVCTGFGRTGPMAAMGGADPMVQSFCGWTSINGQPGGRGEFLRQVHHIDMNASVYIVAAVLEALYDRETTGVGQFVDVNMLHTAVAKQRTRLAEFFATGQQPPLIGSACVTAVPHEAFQCQDRQWLAVGVERDSHWRALCAAIGATDLSSDERFATNPGRVQHRGELVPRLHATFATRPAAWWRTQLGRHHVPCAPLWDFDHIRYHPQNTRNRHIVEVRTPWGKVYTGGVGWELTQSPAHMEAGSKPGADTKEVLASLSPVRPQERTPLKAPTTRGGVMADIKVVELAQGLAGPYCGQLLADAGADVVKVEPPEGDYARGLGPPFQGGESPVFLSLNRNKRSAVLVGRKGAEARQRLLEWADVVIVDSFGDSGRRNGPTYAQVARFNRNVIFCGISPHGERGPLRDQPGTELTIQFMTQVTSGLGRIGDPPVRIGTDAASLGAGVYAYQGVLGALLHRRKTGLGQAVYVSLLGAMMNLKGLWWVCQTAPEQWAPPHLGSWTDPPNHGIATKDIPLSMGFSKWTIEDQKAIFKELGLDPGLLDQLVTTGWSSRAAQIPASVWAPAFAKRASQELVEIFARHSGELMPVNDYPHLVAHPQTNALKILGQVAHPKAGEVTMVNPAWDLHGTPAPGVRRPPPLLGQHTEEVLRSSAASEQGAP